MNEKSDVIIVGAGTAGAYLAWKLAKQGLDVLVLEKDKRENVGKRLDIIHFETDRIEKAGLPPFDPKEPDCIEIREISTVITPDFTTEIKTKALQTIVRLTPFLNKMYPLLEDAGVKIEFSTEFNELIFQEGRIIGVKALKNKDEKQYFSKMVIDASGTKAVVRTSLPKKYGVETFQLGPNEVMHVLLQYIEWLNPGSPHPEKDTGYNYWLLWFGPSYTDDEAILGIGQPGSYENAQLVRKDFLERIELPPYKIIKKEKGITPYRRPPYSLVTDNFLCIGDAACITYPFSGHGVTATWMLCMIASEVIGDIFYNKKEFIKDNLWDINQRYFRDQGAKFAGLLMQLSGVLNLNLKEWSYFLKNDLIYKTGEDGEIPEPNKEYEEDMSFGEMMHFILKILKGLISRKLSLKNIRKLLQANSLANSIRKHYETYPESPLGFEKWKEIAQDLWAQKKSPKRDYATIRVTFP